MRIEAGTPSALGYRRVWDVSRCRSLLNVKWVDDETHQYGVNVFTTWAFKTETIQAKKIELAPAIGTIFIDPIEGVKEEDVEAPLKQELVHEN